MECIDVTYSDTNDMEKYMQNDEDVRLPETPSTRQQKLFFVTDYRYIQILSRMFLWKIKFNIKTS